MVNKSEIMEVPGSQEETPDEFPGSWGERRLKKIPLIVEGKEVVWCKSTVVLVSAWCKFHGMGPWCKFLAMECLSIVVRTPIVGSWQFLNSMCEEGMASSLSAL